MTLSNSLIKLAGLLGLLLVLNTTYYGLNMEKEIIFPFPFMLSSFSFMAAILAIVFYFIDPAPVDEDENPKWFYKTGRFLISLSFIMVPTLYDRFVPEVSGDMRWSYMHIVALIMVVSFLITKIKRGHKFQFKLPLVAWAIIVIAVAGCISYFFAYNQPRSWWFLKHLLSYCTFFAFIYHLRHAGWYRSLLWLLSLTVGFNGLMGILQFHNISDLIIAGAVSFEHTIESATAMIRSGHIAGNAIVTEVSPTWSFINKYLFSLDLFRQAAPPAGTLANKNIAASYVVIAIPAVVGLLLTTPKWKGKTFASVLFSIAMTFLIYTRSRGSWIAFTGALIFFVFWAIINRKEMPHLAEFINKKNITCLAVSLMVISYAGTFSSSIKSFHSMDKSVAEQASTIVNLKPVELSTRWSYDVNGVKIFLDHILTGVGVGNFHTIYPLYHNAWYETPPLGYSLSARPQRMHNDIGQAFVELGIFGGLAYLVVFTGLIWMTWRLARQDNHEAALLSFFLLTGVVGLGINSLGDFPLQMPTAPALLWMYAGMITGLFVMNEKKEVTHIGPKKEFSFHQIPIIGMACATIFVLISVAKDDYNRRQSTVDLKVVISYVHNKIFDETPIIYSEMAYRKYPHYSRMLEYRGIAYSNYRGKKYNIGNSKKVQVLEDHLRADPFSANIMINLIQSYIKVAAKYQQIGNQEKAAEWISKADIMLPTLEIAGDFAPHTYVLKGLSASFKNDHLSAIKEYKRSLEISPSFSNAKKGMQQSILALQRKATPSIIIKDSSGK